MDYNTLIQCKNFLYFLEDSQKISEIFKPYQIKTRIKEMIQARVDEFTEKFKLKKNDIKK